MTTIVYSPSEDEQRNSVSSQKALHAVTVEKEAAMADLTSVERSLSDMFRRYENMKSTLDGFKKVSNVRTSSCFSSTLQEMTVSSGVDGTSSCWWHRLEGCWGIKVRLRWEGVLQL